jgi:hypothetical protein
MQFIIYEGVAEFHYFKVEDVIKLSHTVHYTETFNEMQFTIQEATLFFLSAKNGFKEGEDN